MKKTLIKQSWEDYKGMFNTFKNCWNFKKDIFNDLYKLFKELLFILAFAGTPVVSMVVIIYSSMNFSLWLLLLFPFIIFINIIITNYLYRLNERWRFI